jgi:SAM-dependent methyltransferase
MTGNERQIRPGELTAPQALAAPPPQAADHIWEGSLACPECAVALKQDQDRLFCPGCHRQWPIVGGIPTFVDQFPYWGEISLEPMLKVNFQIQWEYWKTVLLNSDDPSVREASKMILNLDRANWHWLTDLSPESRVLDLGAGMGTNSHALAGRFREVFALEPVRERVEFMKQRFAQDGINNVKILRTSLWDIPFAPNSFDLVVLNGVLEWVATGREGDPKALQLTALKRSFELLRPGGYLYVGIENRMPWQYFIGAPDVHCGLPYVTVLPRPLAHWYARRRGHPEGYRNYIYSIRGYRKLLAAAGFSDIQFYLAIPSYNAPRFYLPLKENVFTYYAKNFDPVRSGFPGKAAHWVFARLRLLKYSQNSFAILAKRET